jgi:cell pole-organizing protein PopZ
MSEAKGQHEPSMEEILASIRRIIAEDGEAAAPPAAPAPRAAAPEPPAPAPPAAHDQDILELTESVAEDGTVVSLTPGGAKKPLPAEAASTPEPGPVEAEPVPEEPEPAEPPPLRLRSAATVARPVEPVIAEPPPAAEIAAARDEPAPRPAAAASGEPPPAAEPPPFIGDRLVSSATAAASVAALSQLADLGQKGQVGTTPLGEAGRTLESLVRELLRPMLRDWMDGNLSPLVERLVRDEIQRLARDSRER